MKLSELLKANGMFSQDIKIRIKNKQMALDGEPITEDIDLNVDSSNTIDAGDFIFENIANNKQRIQLTNLVGFENLSTCNIENDLTRLMKQFHVLRISKRDLMVLRKQLI